MKTIIRLDDAEIKTILAREFKVDPRYVSLNHEGREMFCGKVTNIIYTAEIELKVDGDDK